MANIAVSCNERIKFLNLWAVVCKQDWIFPGIEEKNQQTKKMENKAMIWQIMYNIAKRMGTGGGERGMGADYSKNLFKQLTEQTERIEELEKENRWLRKENTELRSENKRLREKIDVLETSMEDKIAMAVEKAVAQATASLIEELNKAHTEISRLKAIINKDSSNSSKPSSTNGFKIMANSREKSGKPQGGQKGHTGHRLQLPPNINELEAKGILEKRVEDHANGSRVYVKRHTIDIETKIIITEHRYARYADIPPGQYNEVSYGNNIKAQVVLLSNEGVIAHQRLSEIISGLTHNNVNLSTGTIDKILSDFSIQLTKSGELDAIEQDLLNGEVMNTDDTPMRTLERIVYAEDENVPPTYEKAEKKSFRATVRTHSNERSTLYTVNPQKDKKGVERDGILPAYMGNLCHDHESKFYNYGKDNGTCGSHLLRDLKGLEDLYNNTWAKEMSAFVSSVNNYKNKDTASGALFCDAEKLFEFENEYDRIVKNGRDTLNSMNEGSWGYDQFNAMVKRLTNYKDSYMLFIRDYKVPFTNNLAERDLRSEKIKEKISGLFRSWEGIVNHTKIRSFVSTVKKRSLDLFASVKTVIEGSRVLAD